MAKDGPGLDNSFDSREDYELYKRLMSERQRIQRQFEQKKQRRAVKVRQTAGTNLEERERGFQLFVSGANEERIAEANRRKQLGRAEELGRQGTREWQAQTVEIRGLDGQVYRSSPNHRSAEQAGAMALGLESDDGAGAATDGEDSRPGTGASVSSVDQETRGVLRMMNSANRDQLSLLRESLNSHIERKAGQAWSSPKLPPQPRMSASTRSGSARVLDMQQSKGELSRPSSTASSAIASAIQAENARVKRMSEGVGDPDERQDPASRPASRPPSKAGQRLPLSPEVAAECAPPSALSAGLSTPSRRQSSSTGPAFLSHPSASSAGAPLATSAPGSAYPSPNASPAPALRRHSPKAAVGHRSGGMGLGANGPASASADGGDPRFSDEIVDRVGRLDRRKQKALLRVLESLETGSPIDSPQRLLTSEAKPEAAPAQMVGARVGPGGSLDGPGICLRIRSNWGHPRQCGLSHIEALDMSSEVLRIPPAALAVHSTQGGSTTLNRLLEGRGNETQEKLMWAATPCLRTEGGFDPFELTLSMPSSLPKPAAIRLWNFNGPDGLTKGVCGLEVWQDGCQVWAGQVPRGTGTEDAMPAVIALDPTFRAGAASSGTGLMAGVGEAGSPGRERPIWLEGMPVRADMDEQPAESPDDFAGALPSWNFEPAAVPEHERELMQSLKALEQFRSSQSRRFFGPKRTAENLNGAECGDKSAVEDEQLGAVRTANFGSAASGQPADAAALMALGQDLTPGQELAFEGISIPVREFEEHDALDGLVADERQDAMMGSSLVASRFSPTQSVVIPTLPRGRTLVFNCVSTWGDQNFVGLAGIEIFDGHGFPVILKDVGRQVTADPLSINVLPEYEYDPRTPDKLFDQVNLTRDDLHVWLAPFSPSRSHTVTVDLERKMGLSMIRVWNYNKSRLHSSRGVRDMEILLDGEPIFVGEIRRAPGVLTIPEEACEHILFTQDDTVLQAVEEHDWLPAHLPVEPEDEDSADFTLGADGLGQLPALAGGRPPTADLRERGEMSHGTGVDGRPITRASTERHGVRGSVCQSVTLIIHSTWGDLYYVGLTAIEVLDSSLTPIPLDLRQLEASPRDLNDLEGVDEDPRTLDKLLDGVCCTSDDDHMWMAPFVKLPPEGRVGANGFTEAHAGNIIRIDFGDSKQELAGFNMWNYNKNVEDTCRGVREFSVYCDERYIATFLCRKAPGHVHFDFKQVVLLDQPPCADATVRRVGMPSQAPRIPSRGRSKPGSERPPSRDRRPSSRERAPSVGRELRAPQQYETPLHPCGFIFKLLLLSTWSDMHYIGLGGVELYDLNGRPLRPKRAVSNYGSVRNLPGMDNDVRTEECFLHGAPGNSGGRMWLAPFCRQPPNSVELVFDEPTQISCVHFWNYPRTSARGVRDIEIYVDDLLIYQGILRREGGGAPASARGPAAGGGEAVLFTCLPEIVERERHGIYLPSAEELVAFFDETGRVEHRGARPGMPTGHTLERPMTALTSTP